MKMTFRILTSLIVAGALMAPVGYGQKVKAARRVYVSRGDGSYLGIGVVDIDQERAKALNLKEARGVEVKSVEEDSPAAKAGLKEGDVVLEYNGQSVVGGEQFARLVRETPAGREVKLQVQRNGATQTIAATIGTRPGGYVVHSDDGNMVIPPIPPFPPMPPMPRMPDMPRSMMTWRSSTLGIESESLSSQLADYFGVKEGVLVRSVIKDSAADKAGIKAGDVIVKVDDAKVSSPRDITNALRASRTKRTFPVVVVRKQQEMTLTVTLEQRQGGIQARPAVRRGLYC
jgi:serine protease Do